MSNHSSRPRKLAVMGGAYGNLAALGSCLADASKIVPDLKAFIGDSIGCCAHSNEVVGMIRTGFDLKEGQIPQDKLWKPIVEQTGGRFYAADSEDSILKAEAEIDKLLAPLILALWKKGIRTFASCQDEDGQGTVWMQFPTGVDAVAFVQFIANQIQQFSWTADGCYSTDEILGKDPVGMVSIRFHQGWLRDLQLEEGKPVQSRW